MLYYLCKKYYKYFYYNDLKLLFIGKDYLKSQINLKFFDYMFI